MNTKITLVELARLMAEATSTSNRVCELFLRELFTTISQALIEGESVKVKGIGTFKVTTVKPRKSVNVNTGDVMEIKAYKKVSFTPDKSIAEAVNQPFAQFETVFLNDDLSEEKLAEIDEQYPSLLDDISNPPEPAPFPEPENIPQVIGEKKQVASPVPTTAPTLATASDHAPEKEVCDPETEPETKPETIEKTVGNKALAAFGVPVEPTQDEKPVEKQSENEPAEPAATTPVHEPVKSPSTPVAQLEPEEDDGFRRPAPRNTYTPTQEQISRQQSNRNKRKLWWALLAVLAVGVLCWLFTLGGGKSDREQVTVAEGDAVAATIAETEVITDTVTSKIVLSTLSDKYYDSPWFWVYIYEENKAIINDPNNVPPGTAVVIPPAEKYGIDANDQASLKKAQRRSWEILTQGKR